jgi:hypothetical protein
VAAIKMAPPLIMLIAASPANPPKATAAAALPRGQAMNNAITTVIDTKKARPTTTINAAAPRPACHDAERKPDTDQDRGALDNNEPMPGPGRKSRTGGVGIPVPRKEHCHRQQQRPGTHENPIETVPA